MEKKALPAGAIVLEVDPNLARKLSLTANDIDFESVPEVVYRRKLVKVVLVKLPQIGLKAENFSWHTDGWGVLRTLAELRCGFSFMPQEMIESVAITIVRKRHLIDGVKGSLWVNMMTEPFGDRKDGGPYSLCLSISDSSVKVLSYRTLPGVEDNEYCAFFLYEAPEDVYLDTRVETVQVT